MKPMLLQQMVILMAFGTISISYANSIKSDIIFSSTDLVQQ
jgi:hypothetical protein